MKKLNGSECLDLTADQEDALIDWFKSKPENEHASQFVEYVQVAMDWSAGVNVDKNLRDIYLYGSITAKFYGSESYLLAMTWVTFDGISLLGSNVSNPEGTQLQELIDIVASNAHGCLIDGGGQEYPVEMLDGVAYVKDGRKVR